MLRNLLKSVLLILATLFLSVAGYSQYIVLNNGDSISDVTIRESHFFTNEDFITFRKGYDKWQIYFADQLDYFYWNNSYYYSISVGDDNKKRILTYLIHGKASLAESRDKTGEKNYYMFYEDSLINLENSKYELDAIFWENLAQYNEFRNTYSKKLLYDRKTLAEHISRYNNFIDPDLYQPWDFKYGQSYQISLLGAFNQNLFNDVDRTESFGLGISASAGFHIVAKFSPRAAIHVIWSYKHSQAKSEVQEIIENSMGMETSIAFTVYRNKETVVWVGPMIGPVIHLYSSVKQAGIPDDPTNIYGFSLGYYAYAFVEYGDKWGGLFRVGPYKLPVSSSGFATVRPNLRNLHIQLGLTYRIL